MLRWRLILGVTFSAIMLGIGWADAHAARPGCWFAPLAIFIAVAAANELINLLAACGSSLNRLATITAATLPVVLSCLPIAWQNYPIDCPVGRLGWLAVGLVAGLMIVFVTEMARYQGEDSNRQRGDTTTNLAHGSLAVLYIGGLIGSLVQLRMIQGEGQLGLIALVSLIVVVKMSDIGQYTVGRLFGKNKLAPRLSPGKTWEGVAGGVGFAVIGMLLVHFGVKQVGGANAGFSNWSWGLLLLYPLLLVPAGIIGDLAESLLKREAGAKDSSTWLPGFGGVLDLLDSLMMTAPVAYLFWIAA